ncbi:MAG: hypothetical protein JWM04_611 [Verrucomicrobiales bacterium]|jgi:hypothetical protein|nr:hypothetical protein [Verrucomicrobiales bacterium]
MQISIKLVDITRFMSDIATKQSVEKVSPGWIELVQKQVSSIRFGVVQITVHESRVVQVETTEKVRLDKPSADSR